MGTTTRTTLATLVLASAAPILLALGPAPADARPADVVGTSGKDVLYGTGGNDTLDGRAGDDELDPRRGKDVVRAGPGDDYVASFDRVEDRLYGGPGDDTINFHLGDKAYGGTGNDNFSITVNANSFIDCGPGRDAVYTFNDVRPRTRGCEIIQYAPAGRVAARAPRDIEGTDGKDTLNGTAAADTILGHGARDVIDARGGRDLVRGGAGNDDLYSVDRDVDRLYGEGGHDFIQAKINDRVWGGTGVDTVNVADATRAAFVNCGPGEDTVYYSGDRPRTVNCELVGPTG